MSWFRKPDGEVRSGSDNANVDDVEFKPEKFKEDITNEVKTQFETFKSSIADSLKPLNDMATQIATDRAEKAAAARKVAEQKTLEDDQVTTEDYLLDPQEATRKQLKPLAISTMLLAARMARQDSLGDKEYYHGDIKAKVDAMIEQQPLNMRSRADVIENCYKLTVYDHQKDITEGKIKARNTSGIFEGGSTGGHSGKTTEDSDNDILTPDEKRAAAAFNMTEADWKKSRKELSYV